MVQTDLEATHTDFSELMNILSIPRPNGSKALQETRDALISWLSDHNIPYHLHTYKVRPYFLEAIGIWMVVPPLLLALAVWLRWGWLALLLSIIGLLVVQLEAGKGVPILSRIGARQSENIIIEFAPSQPKQELVFSAHYDSKTELMDHRQRTFFMKQLPVAIILSLLLGLLGLIDSFLGQSSDIAFYIGVGLSIPYLILMLGLGANFVFGRFAQPSQGAVDNGAACAILLDLANRLAGENGLQQTKVTIALFTGEEIAAQGSTAYVTEREWLLPTIALNLEWCGQDGQYITWDKYGGGSVPVYSATTALNDAVAAAVSRANREIILLEGPVGTDSVPFLANGIPATSMGTLDRQLGAEGFHRPTDNLERVEIERLSETGKIITNILTQFDDGKLAIGE